ncbi:MAG: hypothetical protein C0432_03435 [Candidatus Puniceispirillum sp.]|nr:hypothetical protein [Candidatus Pelagibacter sp.]MBA4283327.1 hypothetical protein [Candidatus Puniceispirillum sp.]
METILLIAATGFIFYRLWSVLGSRDGFEKKMDWNVGQNDLNQPEDNVIVLSQDKVEQVQEDDLSYRKFDEYVSKIKLKEPDFDLEFFLKGSQKAFKHIVTLFAEGQLSKLSHLVSPQIYEKFRQAIEERVKRQEKMEMDFLDVESEVASIEVENGKALITINFESQQMLATINSDGLCYDNPSRLTATVRDVWTFKKELNPHVKIWTLHKTQRSA